MRPADGGFFAEVGSPAKDAGQKAGLTETNRAMGAVGLTNVGAEGAGRRGHEAFLKKRRPPPLRPVRADSGCGR